MSGQFDCVLIDDDQMILDTWKIAAKSRGKRLACFSDPQDFCRLLENFNKNIKIYIDTCLSDKHLR